PSSRKSNRSTHSTRSIRRPYSPAMDLHYNEADGHVETGSGTAAGRERRATVQARRGAVPGQGAGGGSAPADGRAGVACARAAGPRVEHQRVAVAESASLTLPSPTATASAPNGHSSCATSLRLALTSARCCL